MLRPAFQFIFYKKLLFCWRKGRKNLRDDYWGRWFSEIYQTRNLCFFSFTFNFSGIRFDIISTQKKELHKNSSWTVKLLNLNEYFNDRENWSSFHIECANTFTVVRQLWVNISKQHFSWKKSWSNQNLHAFAVARPMGYKNQSFAAL